jgi:hypothetical protein
MEVIVRVISDIRENTNIEKKEEEKEKEKEEEKEEFRPEKEPFDVSKHFLIVSSRDFEKDEIELLRSYGKVFQYDDCHINIPLEILLKEYDPHYLLFDVRKKNHRLVLTHDFREKFHIMALIKWYELLEDFIQDIDAIKVLKEFPPREATREFFDYNLFHHKIREPNFIKSLFNCIREMRQLYRVVCSRAKSCACQQCLVCVGAPPPIVYAANFIF